MKLLASAVVASAALHAEAAQFGEIRNAILGNNNDTCVRFT
jgi:hypothetical protein